EVGDFLAERVDAGLAAGIAPGALAADPGIGFGKTVDHNLLLLAGLPSLVERVRVPILVGTSRKTFIGKVLARDRGIPEPLAVDGGAGGPRARGGGAVGSGASIARVQEARGAAHAVRLLEALAAPPAEAA